MGDDFWMEERVTGSGRLKVGGVTLSISFTVPAGVCGPEDVLSEVWRLAEQVGRQATAAVAVAGRVVRCGPGCGACCRQMVPVSPAEARHLRRVVDALPAAQAAEIRERAGRARRVMAAAGVVPGGHPDDDKPSYRAYGLAYFREGVACPFLEGESCSIHPVRPLVCREYLVTSSPEHCGMLGSGRVRQVPVPVRWWAVFGRSQDRARRLRWQPLIDALEVGSPEEAASEIDPDLAEPEWTGPERISALLHELAR